MRRVPRQLNLDFIARNPHRLRMAITNESVTLTKEQIDDLNQKLSKMRHDINNHLSLVIFAVEVLKSKPEMLERMTATMSDQPGKITSDIAKFSAEFEQVFGITRD